MFTICGLAQRFFQVGLDTECQRRGLGGGHFSSSNERTNNVLQCTVTFSIIQWCGPSLQRGPKKPVSDSWAGKTAPLERAPENVIQPAIWQFLLISGALLRVIVVVISGGARGADTLGELYAIARGLPFKRFPADWECGKAAGHWRNDLMAWDSTRLCAFMRVLGWPVFGHEKHD
ncbi:SLOG family protein [Ectothiorhodospira shaposhnikovii]|uniref:SLOG family protein n=1 Tax=Ectothiorhodospira shaposhnikovii TaxID=1054 RepID=UPI003B82F259